MAEVEYIHICDYAFAAHGGKPCIIGIFDRIEATSLPICQAELCLAIQLRGQRGETCELKVELIKPDGASHSTLNGSVSLAGTGGAFVQLVMRDVPFQAAGDYTIRVTENDRLLATKTLMVRRRDAPEQPETLH